MKSPFRAYIIFFFVFFSATSWHNDLKEAEQIAKKEHRHILLNFSGSDWCGPCIRLRQEVFDSESFKKLADSSLVLVNADFPRMKKNRLPQKQQELNDAMADQYNSKGKFPLTLLLDSDGRVIKQWEGFPEGTIDHFITEIEDGINTDK